MWEFAVVLCTSSNVHRGERGPQVAELLRVEGYDSRAGEYRLVYE